MFDSNKLTNALKMEDMSKAELARRLGIGYATMLRKISGESEFTLRELRVMYKIFDQITFLKVFFDEKENPTK